MAKHIDFAQNQDGEKCNGKPEWFIHSKRTRGTLGHIVWYPAWRQWVFEAAPNTIWSQDCLADVRAFMVSLNAEKPQSASKQEGE